VLRALSPPPPRQFLTANTHVAFVGVGWVSLAALVTAFSLTACSDPGIVFLEPFNEADEADGLESGSGGGKTADGKKCPANWRYCGQCELMRPPSAQHCYECGMCVTELDHHCPWTGKCIGSRTIRFFNTFLCLLLGHIMYTVVLVVIYTTRAR